VCVCVSSSPGGLFELGHASQHLLWSSAAHGITGVLLHYEREGNLLGLRHSWVWCLIVSLQPETDAAANR